ncbi:MAG: hypothetical protein QME49_01695 [bacterium]|nr:hypothetical protein [bacterium]
MVEQKPKKGRRKKHDEDNTSSWQIEDIGNATLPVLDEEYGNAEDIPKEIEVLQEEYVPPAWLKQDKIVEIKNAPLYDVEQPQMQAVTPLANNDEWYKNIIQQQDDKIKQLSEIIEQMSSQQQKMQNEFNSAQEVTLSALQQIAAGINNQADMPVSSSLTMPTENAGEQMASPSQMNKTYEFMGILGNLAQQVAPLLQILIQNKVPQQMPNDPMTAAQSVVESLAMYAKVQETIVGSLNTLNKQRYPYNEDAIIDKVVRKMTTQIREGGE